MKKKILIVDDDVAFADYVREVADSIDFETQVTSEPRAFKELYMEFSPDVVVSDIAMPDFDGVQLVRWLGEQEAAGAGRCSLVIISGFGSFYVEASKKLASVAGVTSIQTLAKPVGMDDLITALRAAAGESVSAGGA